ncbi:MAG TPA: serine/threonine-protein kinase [Myxococcota bacterium]
MRPPLPNIAEFTAALTVHDVDVHKLAFDEKGTICSPDAKASSSQAPALATLTGTGPTSEILVKGQLSHGGMGQILLAEQSSIGREVAVKIASADKKGGAGATSAREAELVIEARVAGQLEHPNIVPVHILGQNADGKPLIVMKRIEGESWKKVLERGRNLARDVDILMDVCRALHFAHARGVAHRDVKPANVMVGSFGEVYLLDWGVAVGFGDSALVDLPHAKNVARVSGTPHYMAPEMAFPSPGTSGAIDQRTDVYLAGAVLFELITGKAPHARENIQETLYAAHVAEEPSFNDGDGAPEELAAICKKAMQRDPALRFHSAEELRVALGRFQSHAAARELCEDAEQRLAALKILPNDVDAQVLQRVFTECRFGFTHALRTWSESARAKAGLSRAIEHMARREIGAGHYESAALLVGELDDDNAEASAEVRAQLDVLRREREQQEKNVRALEAFAHDHDARIAERERALFLFGAAVGWCLLQFALAALAAADIFHARGGTATIFMAVFASVIAITALLFPRIVKTTASRSLLLVMLCSVVALALLHFVSWWYAIETAPDLALGHALVAAAAATFAAQDKRLWMATLLAALIVPAIVVLPAYGYVISGVGTFFSLSAISWVWRRGK